MSRIKSIDTAPELLLRRALWAEGLRYRKYVFNLPGKPDIVFKKSKVAVFVDGRFWHGQKLSEERLQQMSQYWQEKINRNVARDLNNTQSLISLGYSVLRFTDIFVLKQTSEAVSLIKQALSKATATK